jgi:hypothetical protein
MYSDVTLVLFVPHPAQRVHKPAEGQGVGLMIPAVTCRGAFSGCSRRRLFLVFQLMAVNRLSFRSDDILYHTYIYL